MASRTTGWRLLKRVSLLQLVTEAALPVAKKANKRKGLLDPLGLYWPCTSLVYLLYTTGDARSRLLNFVWLCDCHDSSPSVYGFVTVVIVPFGFILPLCLSFIGLWFCINIYDHCSCQENLVALEMLSASITLKIMLFSPCALLVLAPSLTTSFLYERSWVWSVKKLEYLGNSVVKLLVSEKECISGKTGRSITLFGSLEEGVKDPTFLGARLFWFL